jgi:tRNA(Ile)-lysidine synthase
MIPVPLTDAEFAAALGRLLAGESALAAAVSGGRDSMALMHLSARYAAPRGLALIVLTVDHGLRPESAEEARAVGEAARAFGLRHRVLTWRRPGPVRGNLEARAREARYRLLAEACAQEGVSALLLGHTEDDQAETVLMRLARGSGIDGLSAMAPRSARPGLALLRPLLDIPRARLEARLEADGIAWRDDPMNGDDRFTRVRLRKAQAVLAAAGLTPARLAMTARHMARARLALEAAADALQEKAVRVAPEGYARLDAAPLCAAPEEIGLRLLARLVMAVGGLAFPPRFTGLERLYRLVRAGNIGRGRTLGGCRILPDKSGGVLILRETGLLHPPLFLPPGRPLLWDGRFRVLLAEAGTAPAMVRALGRDGIHALRAAGPGCLLDPVPAPVRPTLPSLWVAGRLAAIPHLNYEDPVRPGLARGFEARFTAL